MICAKIQVNAEPIMAPINGSEILGSITVVLIAEWIMVFVNISNSNMLNHLILFICIINILFVVMSYIETYEKVVPLTRTFQSTLL